MKIAKFAGISLAAALISTPLFAQTTTPSPADRTSPPSVTPGSPAGTPSMGGAEGSARPMAPANDEKARLESVLSSAQTREDYPKLIKQEGFEIAAINDDKPKYVEYEIVKGSQTYEVQLEFDEGAPKAKKIDVAGNIVKDGKTKEMMRGSQSSSGSGMGTTSPRTMTPDGGAPAGGTMSR